MAVEELQKKLSLPQIAPIYQSVSCRRACEKQFETECVLRVAPFVAKWQEIAILLPYLTIKNS